MKTRTKGRVCGTKRRFESKREALAAIRSLVRSKKALPGTWEAYPCRFCDGGYHMGRRGVKR